MKNNNNDNVITLPNGRPAITKEGAERLNDTPKTLTMVTVNQLGGALHRLHELKQQSVLTPTLEAEVRGLIEFLSAGLIEHASELIGSWVAVKTEYEPILNLLATVGTRVSSITHQREIRSAKANETHVPEKQ